MFDLGAGELVLIVFVVLILFGPKKLPELAQSLGRGMREFKRAQREFTEQINQAVNDDHYKKKSVAERETPAGAVSRGGSRRIGGTADDTGAATPTGYPAAGTPPAPAAPTPHDEPPRSDTTQDTDAAGEPKL